VVIPRKDRPGKARQAREHQRAFRRTVKWRTGSEEHISTLKRQYGRDRSRLDDRGRARIWTGHEIFATTWSRSPPWPPDRAGLDAAASPITGLIFSAPSADASAIRWWFCGRSV
jgi:hypothetical protein